MIVLAGMVVFAVIVGLMISHAEPILKARVIETLSTRFHGKVDLEQFHVSIANGLQVWGSGLKIYGPSDLDIHKPGIQPLIGIQEFRFGAGIWNLLRTPMRVHRVYLKGLELNIPAKEQRGETVQLKGKIKIYVDEFASDDARLIINTLRPDKLPLEFAIHDLKMKAIGPGQPLEFDATLTNPKPVGEIQSQGYFGPWQADDPRSTPVMGKYSFSHADLGTIKGIGGILSSTGEYKGTLDNIVVEGQTETPDFHLAISGHPVPLSTEFHAVVDGTSGDTYLQPVTARFLKSTVVARGSVVRVAQPAGHRITLDVDVQHAQIEDLLKLAVRTEPPVMMGAAKLKTQLDLEPGSADVVERIRLAGTFGVSGAHFTNDKVQDKLDAISLRSRGKTEQAQEENPPDVMSEADGVFRFGGGVLTFSKFHFSMPGTNIDMSGSYSLDGNEFDFHGKARLDAKVSQMVGGWKGILLKPVDPFFSKHGAGTEVPVKMTGTKSEPHFGLDFGHKAVKKMEKGE
jgi:hypothetical protein